LAPLQKREQQLCRSAAAVLPRHFVLISLTSNSMEFRTGLVKGPKKLEYGSIKKVEVAASTFLSNSLVSVCFLLHIIQSRHFCDNLSSQPVGNFPSFRNVEAATSTFPLWMGQNFYFPVSLNRVSPGDLAALFSDIVSRDSGHGPPVGVVRSWTRSTPRWEL
jgi:hypothetical protein